MLVYEYKLRLSRAQETAMDEAIRTRTHLCPRCGLILDRDENAALNILAHGLALAREQGRWAQEAGEPTEPSEPTGTVGHTGTERLGTAELLRWGESPAVAPAGGTRNLPDSSGQSVNWLIRRIRGTP